MNKKNLILRTTVSLLLLTSVLSCKITPTGDNTYKKGEFATKPSKVTSITAPNVMTTDDGIPLSWSYVDDASGYYVYYQTANEYLNNATPSSVSMSKDEINYTFNNLKPAERYVFSVQPYKIVGSEIIKGDMSAYVESATKPNLEVKSEVINQNAKLYFSTSERTSVLKTGRDIYEPLFVIESNLDDEDVFNVINGITSKNAKAATLKPLTTTKEEMIELPLKSNSEVRFSVNMQIDKEDILSTKTTLDPILVAPSTIPGKIKSIKSLNGLKDRVELTFEASPINDGFVGEQAFKVVRTAVKTGISETIIEYDNAEHQKQIEPSEANSLLYTFVDKTLVANTEYKYTITPYYIVTNGNRHTAYSSDESSLTLQNVYSLPFAEAFKAELTVINPNASDKKDQYKEVKDGYTTYKPGLTFTLPSFVNTDDFSYTVYRSNVTSRNSAMFDVSVGEISDAILMQEHKKLSETERDGEKFKLLDTITISNEDDRSKNGYQYTIVIENNANQDIESSKAVTSETVSTIPPFEIVFVKNFIASPVNSNAGSITLSFEVVSEEELKKVSASLSLKNVEFTLYRGSNATDMEKIWPLTDGKGDISKLNGKYVDDNDTNKLRNGATYYYQLRAVYNDNDDVNSIYNGCRDYKEITDAKTLKAVDTLIATEGTSTKGITLTFSKVDDASGYAVYYREKGTTELKKAEMEFITIDNEKATAIFTKDVGQANAGKKYEFFVNAIDINGNETSATDVSATGFLYGPYGFTMEATNYDTSEIYKDKIVLTWTEVPHSMRYDVEVYSDEAMTELLETYISKNNTYAFEQKSVENNTALDFPLSRPYYFRVRPILSSSESIENTFLPTAKGAWTLPPKNITASRAESWNVVNVSWDNVGDGAKIYKVYRRVKGSSDWSRTPIANVQNSGDSRLNYLDYSAEEQVDYEYTVTSVIAGRLIESEKQSRFIKDSDEYFSNVGYLLSPPETAVLTENTNEEYTIEVKPFKTIENFVIDMQDANYGGKYIIRKDGDSFKTEATGVLDNTVKVSKNEYGVISVTFKRPSMLLVDSFSHTVRIQTLSEKEGSNETSASFELTHTPRKIYAKEIVNLTNPILYEVLSNANSEFGGDWWSSGQKTSKGDGYNVTSESAAGLGWGADNSFMTFTNYKNARTGIVLSTTSSIKLLTRDEGGAGYLGTDPLDSIGKNKVGELKVTLPGNYGEATIVYDSVKVNGTGGTYTVTYNGATETFDYTQVNEGKRALL